MCFGFCVILGLEGCGGRQGDHKGRPYDVVGRGVFTGRALYARKAGGRFR